MPTILLVLGLAACQNSDDQSSETKTVTVTASAEEVETEAVTPSTESVAPTTDAVQTPPATDHAVQSWMMPDLAGANLQVAQDSIQALTGNPAFYSSSHDATGAGRMQVMDSNWFVCTQTPAPGATFDSSTPVDFGAVKIGELC